MTSSRICPGCGIDMTDRHPSAKFCSDKCRKKMARKTVKTAEESSSKRSKTVQKAPKTAENEPIPTEIIEISGITAQTERTLKENGVFDSVFGQLAMSHARRLENSTFDTASAIASLSRELRATVQEALSIRGKVTDVVDELRERREERIRQATSHSGVSDGA